VLLLVTIALVLVAAVALVIGFVSNQLPPIYLSIACSFVAAVVLALFSRLNRRRVAPAGHGGPAPLVDDTYARSASSAQAAPVNRSPVFEDEDDDEVEEEFAPAAHDTQVLTPVREDRAAAMPRPATPPPPPRTPVPATPVPAGRYEEEEEDEDWDDEPIFPIEDYDLLRVAEILPLLRELDPDELEEVRDREEEGRSRATILNRIDQLLGQDQGFADEVPISRQAPAASTPSPALPSRAAAPTPVRPAAPVRAVTPPPPIPVPPPIREPEPVAMASEPEPEPAASVFPIADYDELRVAQILPLLSQLDPDELEEVAEWERERANRRSILSRIDRLLGSSGAAAAGGAGAAAPSRAAAAAKSTTGKRAAARTGGGVAGAAAAAAAAESAPAKAAPSRSASSKAAKSGPAKSSPGRAAGTKSSGRTSKGAAAKAAPTTSPAGSDEVSEGGPAGPGSLPRRPAPAEDAATAATDVPAGPAGPRSLPRRPAPAPVDPDQGTE
jgi:hypothetical protein